MTVAGIQGYDVGIDALVQRYEQVDPRDKYTPALHLIPANPGSVMDVGCGSGTDAAWFASLGHEVVAVEPSNGLRSRAMALHSSSRIEWMNDSLPHLASIVASGKRFDVIVAAAVWTHLDEAERDAALLTMATLLHPGGVILLSIRQGPPPKGRRSFVVEPAETVACAETVGLTSLLQAQAESRQASNRAVGVTWTWLGFISRTA